MEKKLRNCLLLLLLLLFGAGFPTSLFFLNNSSKNDAPSVPKEAHVDLKPDASDSESVSELNNLLGKNIEPDERKNNRFNILLADHFGIIRFNGDILQGQYYKVYCLNINSKKEELDNLTNNDNEILVNNLTPSSTYRFEFVACNETSCSDPVVTKDFQTDPIPVGDERSGPSELKITNFTEKECMFLWKKPINNTKLLKYSLKAWKYDEFLNKKSPKFDYISVDEKVEMSETLENLQPATKYIIVVNTVYFNEYGNSNVTAECTTLHKK
ncbi:uncharacterized protein LOC122498528 [Leptopilina heterotoma]|uniref:uncharacterized protein LOC122498528 n=1 Tax=Leptopilina heterotoma TaxID=63436 RepID=UPI001CA809E2|nr:uncharacterized protein LOC122498528 [Leptopilina heterotoma]